MTFTRDALAAALSSPASNVVAEVASTGVDVEAIAHAAAAAGADVCTVPCAGISSKPLALDALMRALQAPAWAGQNYDALADCLRDLSWLPDRGRVLILTGTTRWRTADPASFADVIDILDEAAREWTDRARVFSVFVVPDSRRRTRRGRAGSRDV